MGATSSEPDGREAGGRPMRADAQRNRAAVLEAAESVFAAEGISVPVDVIAEKAGVGVGTLYRHFPTKERLFEAIIVERISALVDDARGRIDAADPGAAFFGFLEHLVEESSSKRDLIVALAGAGIELDEIAAGIKAEMIDALRGLLERAQRAGDVRSDVTAELVMTLVGGCCMAKRPPSAEPEEMLAVVCDGLRAGRGGT